MKQKQLPKQLPRMQKMFVKDKKCPECNHKALTKDGHQTIRRKRVQRYLCHYCGRRSVLPKPVK